MIACWSSETLSDRVNLILEMRVSKVESQVGGMNEKKENVKKDV